MQLVSIKIIPIAASPFTSYNENYFSCCFELNYDPKTVATNIKHATQ